MGLAKYGKGWLSILHATSSDWWLYDGSPRESYFSRRLVPFTVDLFLQIEDLYFQCLHCQAPQDLVLVPDQLACEPSPLSPITGWRVLRLRPLPGLFDQVSNSLDHLGPLRLTPITSSFVRIRLRHSGWGGQENRSKNDSRQLNINDRAERIHLENSHQVTR